MNQKSFLKGLVFSLTLAVLLLVDINKANTEEIFDSVDQLEQELVKMETRETKTSVRVQNLDYLMEEVGRYIKIVNSNKLVFDIAGVENADPAVKYLVFALKQSDEELRRVTTIKGVSLFQFKTTVKLVNLLDPYFRSLSESQNTGFFDQSYSAKGSCNVLGADNNCPPKTEKKGSFSSKNKAQKYWEDNGYHKTVWYAQFHVGEGDYTKCVDAYGCNSSTCWFRNHGKISKKGSKKSGYKYVVYRQKDEPNPEIWSYKWPLGILNWGQYVWWWHWKC